MSPAVVCAVPGCGERMIVDYRHVENLEAAQWLCHKHSREIQQANRERE
ncbi:MAG: hypothetical protein WAU98_07400 [Candidatus Nanopelagicaceae bacterium]